jgi:nitroreductase
MLDAAIRAPSGGNSQNWRMLVVRDPDLRGGWRRCTGKPGNSCRTPSTRAGGRGPRAAGDESALRVMRSSQWLADNFEQVPMWVLFFSRNDPTGASIYPAVWNAMLAARGHGVGTCLTTILGIFRAEPTFELLGVPADKGWQLSAAVSCGYPLGAWDVAKRAPVEQVAYSDRWGEELNFEVDGPLWP